MLKLINKLIITTLFIMFTNNSQELFAVNSIQSSLDCTTEVIRLFVEGVAVKDNCKDTGTGCTVSTTIKEGGVVDAIVSNGNNSYTIMGTIELIGTHNSDNFILNDGSYVFPNGSSIKIIKSDEFPELDGEIIDISGVTSNSSGNFNITFLLQIN